MAESAGRGGVVFRNSEAVKRRDAIEGEETRCLYIAVAASWSPIAPQMTRRMYPVFDVSRDTTDGDAYTVEDLVRICGTIAFASLRQRVSAG